MIVTKKYFTYLMRRTLMGILGLLTVIWMLVISVDLIEAMREVGKVEGAGLKEAVQMTLFRTPQILLTMSPFVFLFGTLWSFGQMSKTSEVAVMRAAGLSVWRIVLAPVVLALMMGLVLVTTLDPIASHLASRAQGIKNEMRGKEANLLEQFQDGIWLRQTDANSSSIIRAAEYDPDEQRLSGVTVWRRTLDGVFIERWDAEYADVTPTVFYLRNARRSTLHGEGEVLQDTQPFVVNIDLRALREDVAKPDALSVWELPTFTRVMGSAGMSTIDYQIRYQNLWSLPVNLAAMALIACGFALSMNTRSGGTAGLLGIGVAAGFALFILARFSTAVAKVEIVPVALAAWAPGLLAMMLATSLLLYREDG
ncbi:LPS export ABC transporter permease LptG [Parvularcula sp. LCG005]|uniref:LPS export ABC transporter permease LptG n=1 Tax=Parvularcula sp. LCG005 TaxID=3078805 RepID=UPI002943545A|nr:LPS export ABC transporter permease LptG [Parvularcula sp. LCG005]WOI52293.1 LPS export ABC transporter permease LptG [Parvularcula sp. LCG005]